MAVYVKTASGWDEVTATNNDIRVKTGASTWSTAEQMYVKDNTGTWRLVWDNAAPPPTNLAYTTVAAGADLANVTVTWDQPTIYGFDRYEYSLNGGSTWATMSTNAALRTYTFNNLSENTVYNIGIRVVKTTGRVGESYISATTANSTPTPPSSAVLSSATQTALTWTWTASPSVDLLRYSIKYNSGGTGSWTQIATVNAGINTYTYSSAVPRQSYTLRAYAVDSAGLESTTYLELTGTAANEEAPTNLVASIGDGTSNITNGNHTSVTLTWTGRSYFTGYRVEQSTDGGSNWSTIAASDASTYTVTLSVSSNTNYKFRVRGTILTYSIVSSPTTQANVYTGFNTYTAYSNYTYTSAWTSLGQVANGQDGGASITQGGFGVTIQTIRVRNVTCSFSTSLLDNGGTREVFWVIGNVEVAFPNTANPLASSSYTSTANRSGFWGLRAKGTGWATLLSNGSLSGNFYFTGEYQLEGPAVAATTVTGSVATITYG